MPTYFTPIADVPNQIADAVTFNDPMEQLDLAIDDHWTFTSAHQAELVAARSGHANLDARLDVIENISIVAGGNVVTTANGAASAGQKAVTVISTSGFVAGASVEYLLNGTTLEYNTIDVVTDATHLLLDKNIGTGGILSGGLVALISTGIPMAANAIPHGSTDLTLPQAMAYSNGNVLRASAYGFSAAATATANSAAIAALLADMPAAGGVVEIEPGRYNINAPIDLSGFENITIRGSMRGKLLSNPEDTAHDCVIGCYDVTGYVFDLDGAVNYSESQFAIEGISFDGSGDATHQFDSVHCSPTLAGLVSCTGGWKLGLALKDVFFGYTDVADARALDLQEVFWLSVDRCRFFRVNNGRHVYVYSVGGTTTLSFTKCYFSAAAELVTLGNNVADATFYDCVFEVAPVAVAAFYTKVLFSGCHFEAIGTQIGTNTTGLTPRAFWSGGTSTGNVNCTVTLYSSIATFVSCRFEPLVVGGVAAAHIEGFGVGTVYSKGGAAIFTGCVKVGTASVFFQVDDGNRQNFSYIVTDALMNNGTGEGFSIANRYSDARLITHGLIRVQSNLVDSQLAEVRNGQFTYGIDPYLPLTAAPTMCPSGGKNLIGDRVANSVPTAGGYSGWVCTGDSAELFDAAAAVFTSGIYSWEAQGGDTVTNVNNQLVITYVNSAGGALLYLKDSKDLSADLTPGASYHFSCDAKINTGAATITLWSGGAAKQVTISGSTMRRYDISFVADNSIFDAYVTIEDLGSGEVVTLDNLSLLTMGTWKGYGAIAA